MILALMTLILMVLTLNLALMTLILNLTLMVLTLILTLMNLTLMILTLNLTLMVLTLNLTLILRILFFEEKGGGGKSGHFLFLTLESFLGCVVQRHCFFNKYRRSQKRTYFKSGG